MTTESHTFTLPRLCPHFISSPLQGTLRVRFSPSGLFLAMAYGDTEAIRLTVHTAVTGRPIVRFNSHQGLVYDLQWSHDSQMIITASSDYSARIWALGEGTR